MFTSLIGWYSIASCMLGLSHGLSYDNDEVALVVNNIESETHSLHSCQRTMTWFQIVELLQQQPCAIIRTNHHRLSKRDVNAETIDIKALVATINDHRTMINYLVNNTVNTTIVSNAIMDHHTKTMPILSSWRDSLLILLSVIVFGGIIRLFFKSKGPNPCDSLFLCLLSRATAHGNKQEQQQQQQPPKEHILKQKQQHILPMEPYNSRFDNGYISE